MRTLLGAMRGDSAGAPIPCRIDALNMEEVHFRTGELTLVAAAPGGFKTVLALTLAAQSGVPTLYFSPDTSVRDISSRLISMVTGEQHITVEAVLNSPQRHKYDDVVASSLSHIRWDFNPQPTVTDIEEEAEAFAMLFGDYPHLVVVDCLRNLIIGADDDNTGFRHGMEGLAALAKNTGSAVVVLHHLVGAYDDGQAPSLSAIEGKVSKNAALVLGLSATLDDPIFGGKKLCVSVLKNRSGPADPRGFNRRIYIPLNPARMKLG